MTTLSAIIAAVAGLPVTFGSATPDVRWHGTTATTIAAADVPVRIIAPYQSDRLAQVDWLTPTGRASVEWQIADMLLVRPAGAGRGARDYAADISVYLDDYITHVANSPLRDRRWMTTRLTAGVGLIAWPPGQEAIWEGVTITLTIRQLRPET